MHFSVKTWKRDCLDLLLMFFPSKACLSMLLLSLCTQARHALYPRLGKFRLCPTCTKCFSLCNQARNPGHSNACQRRARSCTQLKRPHPARPLSVRSTSHKKIVPVKRGVQLNILCVQFAVEIGLTLGKMLGKNCEIAMFSGPA